MILEFIERLVLDAEKEGLDFLIIGGHAVAHHGYPRMTLDVDFLIRDSQSAAWRSLLERYRYRPHTESAAFIQFASGTPGWPAMDLMLVYDETWKKLKAGAVRKPHGRTFVCVPQVRHLIALKLHAAKSPTRGSPEKDWNDIEELLRLHRLNPNDTEFAELIVRYGGEDSLARLRKVWQDFHEP